MSQNTRKDKRHLRTNASLLAVGSPSEGSCARSKGIKMVSKKVVVAVDEAIQGVV